MTQGRKVFLGYAAYALVALVFFAFLLFPSDRVRNMVESSAAGVYPGIDLEIGDVSPSLLFGLKFEDVEVRFDGRPCLDASYIRVSPSLLALIGGDPSFSFEGNGVFKGRVDGEFKRYEDGGAWKVAAGFSGIRLDAMPFLKDVEYFSDIKGSVDGTLEAGYGSRESGFSVDCVFSGVELVMSRPVFALDSLAFDRIETVVSVGRNDVKIKRLVASGKQLDGELYGSVLITRPYEGSRLNIRGFVKPHANFVSALGQLIPADLRVGKGAGEKGFPVRIGGTFGKPSFSLR